MVIIPNNKLFKMAVNPQEIQINNAIKFPDGDTWYISGKPDATFVQIVEDWKMYAGNHIITTEYPGLQFGQITATLQDYQDCLTSGLKKFFEPFNK